MKILAIVFAVCFVGALADLTLNELANLYSNRTHCITETGVDEANVDAAKDHNDWKMDDLKLRCYFFCMQKKIKIMNEDGTLNEEITRQMLAKDFPEDKIDGVMMKCKDMKGADMCETAMMMTKCHVDERALLRSTEKSP
ncbi:uncharacterized protein LOC130674778 [Microplitis mediator]|uniref:uncharacterized protein LOC130674778 n=1 Tax=Microplitis mediator TaxID=375433 RepID=UPI002553A7C6|nr:uncharacterized protein LOC130674778 [Microplitis mediator]